MSKYHPIDVRHPANRKYQHRNYLLDPPRRDAPSSVTAPRAEKARAIGRGATGRQSQPSGPWGLLQGAGGAGRATPGQSGNRGFGRVALIVGLFVIYAVVRSQPQLWDQITRLGQQLYYDWGLYQYF
ncbi:MAG: hypothetical protein H6899_08190 [Rhodobacter sp.]|nr:hypothetical protein [Paracoccaceae bacterium]MCC0079912.1 hypothetical protein [Rhodobacter sp.]